MEDRITGRDGKDEEGKLVEEGNPAALGIDCQAILGFKR